MAAVYYHYTSRQFAQDIYCTGKVDNPHGVNYITPDLYTSGAEAAQSLGITKKPVEVICVIPGHVLQTAMSGRVPASTVITGVTDPVTGALVRRGGGNQIVIPQPIHLNPVQFINLAVP